MIGNDKSSREEKCLWYSGDLGIRKASMILLLLHETKRRQLQTRLRDVLRVVLRVSQLKLPSYHGVSLYLVRVLFDGESLVATSEKINNRLSFIFSSDMYIIVSRCTQVYTFLARLYRSRWPQNGPTWHHRYHWRCTDWTFRVTRRYQHGRGHR